MKESRNSLIAVCVTLVVALCFVLVYGQLTKPAKAADASAVSGTFTSTQQGFGGDVEVTLTIEKGTITAAKLVGDGETPAVGGAALPTLEENIVAAGNADFDLVSGATVTSTAVKTGVEDALTQAGLN